MNDTKKKRLVLVIGVLFILSLAAVVLSGGLFIMLISEQSQEQPQHGRIIDAALGETDETPREYQDALVAVPVQPQRVLYLVKRVIDGDTLVVTRNDEDITVRLLGVDTPETKHPRKPVEFYGPEATEFMTNLLTGESVYLEIEKGNEVGYYGRTLAYLYRASDNLDINAELVAQGYAKVYEKDKCLRYQEFKTLEDRAKRLRLGLWQRQEEPGDSQEEPGAGDQSYLDLRLFWGKCEMIAA